MKSYSKFLDLQNWGLKIVCEIRRTRVPLQKPYLHLLQQIKKDFQIFQPPRELLEAASASRFCDTGSEETSLSEEQTAAAEKWKQWWDTREDAKNKESLNLELNELRKKLMTGKNKKNGVEKKSNNVYSWTALFDLKNTEAKCKGRVQKKNNTFLKIKNWRSEYLEHKLLSATKFLYTYSTVEQQGMQIKDMCPICQNNTRQLQ